MEIIPFSKKGKRQLSDFLAQELLYDYSIKQLDQDRTKAIRQALNQSSLLSIELNHLKEGANYCEQISQIRVSPAILTKMKQPFSFWGNIEKIFNIRTWSPGLQWMGESLIITISLTVISFIVPWQSLVFNFITKDNEKIILTSIDKKNNIKASDEKPEIQMQDQGQGQGRMIAHVNILRKYIFKVANPQFTYNKLSTLLPKFGANITDQILVPVGKDTIPQVTFSIPQDRAEALIKELESNGKLTLSHSSGENEKEKEIWTFQLELEK